MPRLLFMALIIMVASGCASHVVVLSPERVFGQNYEIDRIQEVAIGDPLFSALKGWERPHFRVSRTVTAAHPFEETLSAGDAWVAYAEADYGGLLILPSEA